MPRLSKWLLLSATVAAAWALFGLARLPSPALFGALAAGLGLALLTRRPPQLPGPVFTVAQAVLGVAIGALLDLDTLRALQREWLPVLAVCLATLGLSLAAGYVLCLHPGISAPTGVFSMIAGGASGVVAIARELGADDRTVAVVQYLRVLLIVVGMPVVARVVFDPGRAGPAAQSLPDQLPRLGPLGVIAPGSSAAWLLEAGFTVACVAAGLLLARRVRIPAAALLMPLLIAAVSSLFLPAHSFTVPEQLQDLGFAAIGLQVGLRFTRQALRDVAALLPLALAAIAGLVLACAGLGLALAAVTGRSALDGYLATTPGGLYAVLATAIGGGGDVTFVLTVQIVRLFVMLFSAPVLAAWLRRGQEPEEVPQE